MYYKSLEFSFDENNGFLGSKSSRSKIVNLNIFEPKTGKSTLLFKEHQRDGIAFILFETGIKNGELQFNGISSGVMNNTQVANREPRDRILVGVRTKNEQATLFYVADKKGSGLKLWLIVPSAAHWHIDAKNSKLRIVQQSQRGISVESYDW